MNQLLCTSSSTWILCPRGSAELPPTSGHESSHPPCEDAAQ